MLSHLKMLCVDDNPELRQALVSQFEAEDFDVESAEDGAEALQKIKSNNYDIVLLDVRLPKLDGKEVLKQMQAFSKTPHVVMLSAVNEVDVALECVKLGAKDYIAKPYDPEELLHVVIKVLGS